jgi:hypothetical protein
VGKELFEPVHELKDFDDYTFTHALNVCVLSSALGRAIGASEEMINVISLAALCHDLGKKDIPKKILNKKGPLEREERISIEKHPASGAELLIEIPGVESQYPLLPVVAYQHHMGVNQSGYPKIQECFPQYTLHFSSLLVHRGEKPLYERLYFPRSDLPAITHIDYSARIQSVNRETNPRYWELIHDFKMLTGYGVIVNTSFNVRGEPIVCTPDDAYRCFMRTEMDFLVLFHLEDPDMPDNFSNVSFFRFLTKKTMSPSFRFFRKCGDLTG